LLSIILKNSIINKKIIINKIIINEFVAKYAAALASVRTFMCYLSTKLTQGTWKGIRDNRFIFDKI